MADEIEDADFSFLKKLSDKKLVSRMDVIRAQMDILSTKIVAGKSLSKSEEIALRKLQMQETAIIIERLRRFD